MAGSVLGREFKTPGLNPGRGGDLTFASSAISSISLVTGTGEATRSVGTGSISAAVVIVRRSTFINI